MKDANRTLFSPEGLFIDDGGTDGIPVVFVHSAAGSTAHWAAQLASLRARGRRAIAVDLRGHGQSRPPADGDYSIAGLASDIGAAADFLGLGRIILIGHSLGSAVAGEYAGRHPERVAGLILVDPGSDAHRIPDEEKARLMESLEGDRYRPTVEQYWLSLTEPSSESVRRKLFDGLWQTRREAVIEPLRSLLDFDAVSALSRYPGPTHVIAAAANDGPGGLHTLVPSVTQTVVKGTGHWLQLDAPEETSRLIDEFLARVDP